MREQGRDPSSTMDAIQKRLRLQQQKEVSTEFGFGQHLFEKGGVDYCFVRFFNHVIQVRCSSRSPRAFA